MSETALPPTEPAEKIQVLISQEAIQARIQEMANDINQTYAGCEKLVVIAILKGSFMFLADLIRHLKMPVHVEFVRLASYGNHQTSSGTVKPVDLTLPNLADKDVLIVEDIMDTGLTMRFFMDYLRSLHKTRSLRLAVLLDKPACRSDKVVPVPIDFFGFQVGKAFVVGYGLDAGEFYRNLPYIGLMTPDQSDA